MLALAQFTNKAFTDAGKGLIRQSLTALVQVCGDSLDPSLIEHQQTQCQHYIL